MVTTLEPSDHPYVPPRNIPNINVPVPWSGALPQEAMVLED
jgi:hypothetical protein